MRIPDALRMVFWGRGFFLFLLCVSAWGFWLTGIDRVVSGNPAAGCYLDGNRTQAATTATPVVYDAEAPNAAPAGHTVDIEGQQTAKGEMVSYRMANGEPVGDLSAANRGLPPRSCAVWFESAEFPATYGNNGKLWLVDCCDDAADGTLYQASAPDWNADTTWPEAFPPQEWEWDVTLVGLPAQRLRSGVMGNVVTSLGMLTVLLMFTTSALLVWRQWSAWPAERSVGQ